MGSKDPPNSPILRERPLAREGALGCFTLNGPPSAAQPGGLVWFPCRQPLPQRCPIQTGHRQGQLRQAARGGRAHRPSRGPSGLRPRRSRRGRKSVGEGKRGDLRGRPIIKKKKKKLDRRLG